MSEVPTPNGAAVAITKPKPPAPGKETDELLQRGLKSDQSVLPQIRALFADGDRGSLHREMFGSPAEWLRLAIKKKAAGESIIMREAIDQTLDKVRSELAGPNPTPIERLLAERAAFCWFIVHWYENAYANSTGWNIDTADLQHRKIDKAHARFLSALLTLARIRKLALPTLQVNIARNQVNVAESGP
jgi:hypothetical protein